MKNLLKYLLVFIVTIVFLGRADGAETTLSEISENHVSASFSQQNISSPDTECCVPRQVSFASPNNIQSCARRTSSPTRSNFEFTKSGKVINADLLFFIQKESVLTHSSLLKPAHKLIYLGKLII